MPAMSELKSAFVGIIGRPSSGKSTFLNSVCGRKVSIVSTVPQTTRNKIRGICHSSTGQLVFVDTPGYHISNKRMNNRIKNVVLSAIHEVDILLHIADISRLFGEEERSILSLLTAFPGPTIIALNKIDCKKTFRKEFLEKIRQLTTHTPYLEISGLYGNGIPELLSELFSMAPIGEQFYPKEFYTDQPPEFRISEIIREKAIQETTSEVPHALFVEIADLEMRGEDRLWVRGFIYVERESQKGIVVGKGGNKIRKIVEQSNEELRDLFPYDIDLDIRVKVRSKWRTREQILKKLIQ